MRPKMTRSAAASAAVGSAWRLEPAAGERPTVSDHTAPSRYSSRLQRYTWRQRGRQRGPVWLQGARPKEELLSGECQALMDLGDAPSFDEFEAALQGGRLVSQLSRLQSALNLPVRVVAGLCKLCVRREVMSMCRACLRPVHIHLHLLCIKQRDKA